MHTITTQSQAVDFQANFITNNVYFKVSGGLGNQFFCLSEAYRLHQKFNRRVVLDVTKIDHNKSGIPEWLDFIEDKKWAEIVRYQDDLLVSNQSKMLDLNLCDENRIKTPINIQFSGWKFDWERVSESGLFTEGINPFLQTNAVQMEQTGIHFRGGDYFKSPGIGVLGSHYYLRALEHCSAYSNEIQIYSDDEKNARSLFGSFLEEDSFTISQETSPLKVLNEMSRSKNFIGSNSTLSWWAAYFANQQLSVMPTPFYLQRNRNERGKKNTRKVFYINRHKNIFIQQKTALFWELLYSYEKIRKTLNKIIAFSKY